MTTAGLIDINLVNAQMTAEKTLSALNRQGYCLWKCQILSGETIVIINDKFPRLINRPRGYPVYLLREIEELADLPEQTIRLVHQAKKTASARVISVEKR